MWANADPAELRAVWGEQLGRFVGEDIRDALEIVPKAYQHYPPTLPEFVELCSDARRARAQTTPKLTGPRMPMPDNVRAQLRAFVDKAKR